MLYFGRGSENDNLSAQDIKEGLLRHLTNLATQKSTCGAAGYNAVLFACGRVDRYAWQYYGAAMTDILPALGTHAAMTAQEIARMFGDVPQNLFRVHDWRGGLVTLGQVPSEFLSKVSEGKLDYTWPAQVDTLLVEGKFDLILSLGQVVPHEVIGMANYNKNIFVGTGGSEGINKSHFLGAVYGMERIMGRVDTPVRKVLNCASKHFAKDMPIVYVQTVVCSTPDGPITRGLFIGDDEECFRLAQN